jgi:hypothetical protein
VGVFLPGDSTRRSVFSTHTRKRGGIDLWGCCGRRNTSQGGGQISTVFLRAVSFNFYGRQRSKQQQHTSNSRTKRTSPDCLMIPCFASDYQRGDGREMGRWNVSQPIRELSVLFSFTRRLFFQRNSILSMRQSLCNIVDFRVGKKIGGLSR